MVSGGPYGLESIVGRAGYGGATAVLLVTPVLWSLPTALMVAELSSAMPEDGGFYVWVRRALGPFWGFQEAWLSLAASVADMAIYPTLFALYLGKLWPPAAGPFAPAVGAGLVGACAWLNARGSRAVGGASVALGAVLLAPFAAFVALGLAAGGGAGGAAGASALPPGGAGGLLAGTMVAMWNYMGWDNASTVAAEVRDPRRTYPRAMVMTVALVSATYVAPVLAAARAGLAPGLFSTGAWADAGEVVGGRWLRIAIVVGGLACGAGMFNALVLSYSRLPFALARDGYLPAALGRVDARTGAPRNAIVACSVAYLACLGLGFDRLVELDVVLYGASLALEFVALVVLRVREPDLPRPFRVPGGLCGAILVGVGPAALLGVALWQALLGPEAHPGVVGLGAAVAALGPLVYRARRRFVRRTVG
jgi:amino acid transporter